MEGTLGPFSHRPAHRCGTHLPPLQGARSALKATEPKVPSPALVPRRPVCHAPILAPRTQCSVCRGHSETIQAHTAGRRTTPCHSEESTVLDLGPSEGLGPVGDLAGQAGEFPESAFGGSTIVSGEGPVSLRRGGDPARTQPRGRVCCSEDSGLTLREKLSEQEVRAEPGTRPSPAPVLLTRGLRCPPHQAGPIVSPVMTRSPLLHRHTLRPVSVLRQRTGLAAIHPITGSGGVPGA